MKKTQFTCSIVKNSVYSDTESNWSHITPGSLIKFPTESQFYTVSGIERLNIQKEFTKLSGDTIRVDEINECVSIGDEVSLNYREFEIFTVKNIISGGGNNRVGNLLTIKQNLITNTFDNSKNPAIARIESVNGNGEATSIKITNRGAYSSPFIQIQLENGIIIEPNFKQSDNLKTLERNIVSLDNGIKLNYNLPEFISSGVLNIVKWKIILDETPKTNTGNITFEVFRDFTPNLALPLMLKNSKNSDEIYNHAIKRIDLEISIIKQKLGILG